jgi:hypothetical protein
VGGATFSAGAGIGAGVVSGSLAGAFGAAGLGARLTRASRGAEGGVTLAIFFGGVAISTFGSCGADRRVLDRGRARDGFRGRGRRGGVTAGLAATFASGVKWSSITAPPMTVAAMVPITKPKWFTESSCAIPGSLWDRNRRGGLR